MENSVMVTPLTAHQFRTNLENGETDFTNYGQYVVNEELVLKDLIITSDVNLGQGEFYGIDFLNFDCSKSEINCNESIFNNWLNFDQANIAILKFSNSLVKAELKINDAKIFSLDFGNAKFKNVFYCGSSKSNIGHLNLVQQPTFDNLIVSDNNPAMAWILQQYKTSNVQYSMSQVPERYKRRL